MWDCRNKLMYLFFFRQKKNIAFSRQKSYLRRGHASPPPKPTEMDPQSWPLRAPNSQKVSPKVNREKVNSSDRESLMLLTKIFVHEPKEKPTGR